MLETYLNASTIAINQCADSYKDAIRIGGNLLIQSGAADDCFVSAMIDAVKKFGPYMVIAPGIALPHARPEDGARAVGMSLVTLKTPVYFGNPENDPVNVVACLCSTDSTSHLELLQRAVDLLGNDEDMAQIIAATSLDQVLNVIRRH